MRRGRLGRGRERGGQGNRILDGGTRMRRRRVRVLVRLCLRSKREGSVGGVLDDGCVQRSQRLRLLKVRTQGLLRMVQVRRGSQNHV